MASIEKRQTSLTPAEVETLASQYAEGATVAELASTCGAHRETVSRHLKRAGVRMRRRGLSSVQAEAAKQLYLNGLTLLEIESQLGAAANTIRLRLRGEGVTLRRRPSASWCPRRDAVGVYGEHTPACEPFAMVAQGTASEPTPCSE